MHKIRKKGSKMECIGEEATDGTDDTDSERVLSTSVPSVKSVAIMLPSPHFSTFASLFLCCSAPPRPGSILNAEKNLGKS
jgi:hypothetical protein